MMRYLLVLTAVLFVSAHAHAQESINVRVGEHDTYSRIVFDWPSKTTFNALEGQDALTITFEKAAKVPATINGNNFNGIDVVSQDPLSVKINIPSGAKTRSFPVANRVVVDVYGSGKASSNAAAPSKEPKPKVAAVPPKTVEKVEPKQNLSAPSQNALDEVQNAIKDVDGVVAKVITQGTPPSDNKEEPENKASSNDEKAQTKPVEKKMNLAEMAKNDARPNLFTLSATKSIGMAVFDNFGQLWMVTDQPEIFVKPKIAGPNADFFTPIEEKDIAGGRAYISKVMPEMFIKGQGGGLLWNVFVTPEDPEIKAPEPKRVGVKLNRARSGKVIWPFKDAKNVLDVKDPISGAVLKVVTVESSQSFSGAARSFVDFDVLPSPIGLAIRPKVSDLNVKITDEGVEIYRDAGLSILSEDKVKGIEKESFEDRMASSNAQRRLFNFDEWRMGGLNVLNENENIILSGMKDLSESTQIENLITLAKMQLANGRGAEALGYLNFAQRQIPELVQNPEFLSYRGVAKAFDWKTDEAFRDLSASILEDYAEIDMWRAFVLADLGDWQQAFEILPKDITAIQDYPPEVRNRLGVVLAEIFLRAGEVKKAEQLFDFMEKDELNLAHEAAMKYLQGEAARQNGQTDETIELWKELAEGGDDLYRVKAGLALTRFLQTQDKIKPKEAIDRLERLRFAWRGDELEAQVNYWLGRTYFENEQYTKGLTIMREAASLVPGTILGERIAGDMSNMFTNFFLEEGNLEKTSPLDSVTLYEQFQELVPAGPQGNALISSLAEQMVQADLLDRAARLLSYQINHRLSGDEAARTATRLAAINLIDKNPKDALLALNKATDILTGLPEEIATRDRFEEISLLRARALSQNNQTDQALAILENLPKNPVVNRLRADIAWTAGFWDDASYALEDVILDENISLTRPLDEEHAMLILQRAVAQNLSGDRIGLANLREKYSDAMSQTDKTRLFDVVTRARQNSGLADRDTLLSTVAEIDLFADFLNSYKETDRKPSN